jgi:hypothetical protein
LIFFETEMPGSIAYRCADGLHALRARLHERDVHAGLGFSARLIDNGAIHRSKKRRDDQKQKAKYLHAITFPHSPQNFKG